MADRTLFSRWRLLGGLSGLGALGLAGCAALALPQAELPAAPAAPGACLARRFAAEQRDVLEKVTLIKDIVFAQPHRAHVEILADLALPKLAHAPGVSNFVELHRAWRAVLDSSELNRRFFREVANWYFWAVEQVEFPAGAQADRLSARTHACCSRGKPAPCA